MAQSSEELNGAIDSQMEMRHLRRTIKTALELAIVAPAPADIVQHLANVAGMLEALSELPADSMPAKALLPGVLASAYSALDGWQVWEKSRSPSA